MYFQRSIVPALKLFQVVVWGETALDFVGVKTMTPSYMVVPSEEDFDALAQHILDSGFRSAPWSYATNDPKKLKADPVKEKIYREGYEGQYQLIDDNSLRFKLLDTPPDHHVLLVLIRSKYVGLAPPTNEASAKRFTQVDHLFYPDRELMLQSVISTLLKDKRTLW
ncbi:hypothetical protein EST38_g11753 [Candolleomyces aberdarensis]|uniref:Uncharacterized protein n=1 Tax=Candolleomyces aberdarensis TaxID=2316362 RepID=A0A4V1Q274_9AGAR|nr:hypothetical protein EST38_g11753 [Candolleomyces aberdarensis]